MKTISAAIVRSRLVELITDCLIKPDKAVTEVLRNLSDAPAATVAAKLIAQNNDIAASERIYACQDTGQAVFFVKLGDEISCKGLHNAIVEATREAYAAARKSVADPLTRENTHDNTPPIIETELVSGDALEISFLAKGAGSENMTKLYMLTPADGKAGIIRSVVEAVENGGRNACPPLVVGVGIGGVSETACRLSKLALLRPLGERNARADVAELERELLEKVNALNIGVAALGGKTTALAVNMEVAPTHIGMLPVAVNLQCHSLRHGTVKF
ncbi:MAG: fumarate hydratase [Clostridiales bacterium]|nr:fumarate hydratase [Clostridiales bacterium]